MAKIGDSVKITTKDETYQGVIMPSESEDFTVIKLDNGYNIGIDKKNIVKTDVVKKFSEKKIEHPHIKHDKKLPKIVVIHTGGTIASRVDYETGGVSAKFSAKDLIELVPELPKIANIESDTAFNIMSEDINFHHYTELVKKVKSHMGKCEGIIIGHGTDTLSYTSSALSFALGDIDIPVLLVGSQRSSDRPSSDSIMNLICAATFIAKSDYKGVAICMHHSSSDDKCAILPATKSRKMHTSRRDAFRAINSKPIAFVHSESGKIEYLNNKTTEQKIECKECTKINDKFSKEVGLLKAHPNMNVKLFEFYTKNYKAIVIEATGLGHAPVNTEENSAAYEQLKAFINNGGIVAITSQCIYGRVHPHVYSNLRRLSDIGCVFCEDMLPETAYIKLAWLLGNFDSKTAKECLSKNIRGEINTRTKNDDFLN